MYSFNVSLLSILLMGLCLSACHPVMIDHELPQSSAPTQEWEDVLASSPRIDQFKILHTGAVNVPLSGMLNLKKLPEDHGMSSSLWVDVYAFLFHHQDKGWFMIDTGLDSSYQAEGNISGLLAGNYIQASRQEKGQNIAAHLARENKPIQGIFFTHLHGDHTAGLPEIDSRIPKLAGKGEKDIHIPLLYHSAHLTQADTVRLLDWDKGTSIAPFSSVIDLFGDQSLFAIHTPGHTEGHSSYLLNTSEGLILLTGDASHTRYGFEAGIEPGWTDNKEAAVESLEQLRVFAAQYPEMRVIFGHEQ